MSNRSAKILLQDIVESLQTIQAYTTGLTFSDFYQDQKTRDAVVMQFLVVGEAAGRIPLAFKKQHSQLPWKELQGLRNRIAHDYLGIDHAIVWEIVENKINALHRELLEILNTIRD